MFHVKHLAFIALLTACSLSAISQGKVDLKDKPFAYQYPTDSTLWQTLAKDEAFRWLSQQEKEFFYWTNVFRRDPKKFYDIQVTEFLRQYPEANTAEARSLKADLSQAKPLGLLLADSGLNKMAQTHARDLAGRGGVVSHYSANGKGFVERIKEAGRYRCGAENIFVGSPDALEALIILLIDHGVANKGHRKNLMDPMFTLMGVQFPLMNEKRAVLVQTLGCK